MIRNKSKALKKAPLIIKKMTEIQNMKATYLEEDVSKLIADMKKSEEMYVFYIKSPATPAVNAYLPDSFVFSIFV